MPNNYNSIFTGAHNDEYDSRIAAIENRLTVLENANEIVAASAYYTASGDTTFQTWVPFNAKYYDTHNAFNTSNGRYIVPKAGLYLVIFSFYSNTTTAATNQRPAIGHYNSAGTQLHCNLTMGTEAATIANVWQAAVGDYFVTGTYASNWNVSFWAGGDHNLFTIAKVG